MKILILDTYYAGFLRDFYTKYPNVLETSYDIHRQALLAQCFGTSDYYSRHLQDLGVQASDIVANSVPLQRQWAKEHGIRFSSITTRIPPKWQRLPIVGRWLSASRGLLSILVRQIEMERPDVLYVQDLSLIPPQVLAVLKSSVRLVVGQIACPLPPSPYLAPYDLILTSFPHYVSRFRERGIASEYFRIGFDSIVLAKLGTIPKRYGCTFVGGISRAHKKGADLLEYISRRTQIEFFGYGVEALPGRSPIKKTHHGEVWGLDMYRALYESHITLNRHIDVAENYANNMRLFEATGCGAMLLTDAKENLNDLFKVGKEVVTYSSPEEAVEMIEYYSSHPAERDAIAKAGQARTLSEHTYEKRMEELVPILQRYLDR